MKKSSIVLGVFALFLACAVSGGYVPSFDRATANGKILAVGPTGLKWTSDLVGATGTSSAPTGVVGEYIVGTTSRSSSIALSTGVPRNTVIMSLTAGDWDVDAVGGFNGVPTGVSFLGIGVTATSGTLPAIGLWGDTRVDSPTPSNATVDTAMSIPGVRVSIAATTTYYLVQQATFTGGNCSAFGRMSARRAR